mgnify:CR=1 FL=1
MKKITIITLLFVFSTALIAPATDCSTSETNNTLAGKTWIFKRLKAENPYTVHYLATVYEEAQYRFSDNHRYTGSFFGLPISGTWEVSDNNLVLDKGTSKEETYRFVLPASDNLVIVATEKGNEVFIEFEKV